MSAFGQSRITTERRSRAICLAGICAVVKPINPITRHDVRIWINGEHRTFDIMPALAVIKRHARQFFNDHVFNAPPRKLFQFAVSSLFLATCKTNKTMVYYDISLTCYRKRDVARNGKSEERRK